MKETCNINLIFGENSCLISATIPIIKKGIKKNKIFNSKLFRNERNINDKKK